MIVTHHAALVLGLVLAVTTSPSPRSSPFSRQVNIIEKSTRAGYRLPTNIVPSAYNVKLVPYITEGNFTFDGEVLITVQAMEATTNITLHANRLTIDESKIVVRDVNAGEDLKIVEIEQDSDFAFYSIILDAPLSIDVKYTVYFGRFNGILDSDMTGFYRSSYTENGIQRWLATTQFESTGARRAFPCFDEPALKARFTISISRTENMRAISNMPQDGVPVLDTEHTNEKRYWDHFLETPPMATYLVAFIVSDFVYLENAAQNLRIFAQPQMISQARYALGVSPPLLNWLADFTGIDYQLPKMDEAAIPDFDAGAMENWGLVTYREVLLLFEEGVSSTSNKQSIATVIAHEYTHQWFGDLVTMQWWKYTWLNEGFATYFEYFCTAGVEPSWRLDEQFVFLELQDALSGDATQNSHPMTYDVETPGQISSIFDTISYAKGGSVIRMMKHIISPDTFQRGLNRYLVARSYNWATADELFNNLNEQLHEDNPSTDIDLKTVMDTWTLQMGYPVLTVTRNYATKTATLTQERFLLTVDPNHPDKHDYRWHIPLTYTTQGVHDFQGTSPRDWFNAEDDTKTIANLPADNEWVLFNIQETGYYRVNYDLQNWELLTAHLDSPLYEDIHLLNRAQLVDDAFNLARAEILTYDTPLALSQYLVRETDYVVWKSALNAFTFIDRKLSNTQDYAVFQSYLLSLIDTLYVGVGFEAAPEDDHVLKLNRATAVRWACDLGAKDCSDKSTTTFDTWIRTPTANTINPDLKSAVYCTALRNRGTAEWDFLYQQYLDANVGTERTLIISALGCTNDASRLEQMLTLAITEGSSIRRQDSNAAFSAVYSNPSALDTALDFVIANFQKIATYYGSMNSVSNLLINIGNRCNRQDQADKIQRFHDSNTAALGDSAASVARAVTIVNDNVLWVSTTGEDIIDWILANTDIRPNSAPSAIQQGSTYVILLAALSIIRNL